MKLSTVGWILVAASWAPFDQGSPTLDGRLAASYAYMHVFDPPSEPGYDRTTLVFQAMAAGGWPLPRESLATEGSRSGATARADALMRFLDGQRGVVVREIAPRRANVEGGFSAAPGDILMADWGDGDENAPANENRASRHASEFMIVQGSLGNGDFVYCRNAGEGRTGMGRFFSLLNSPNLALARYKIYHIVGNDPIHGFQENAMYRDENQRGVFLHVNGGFFWVRDDATVKIFGGWARVNALPKNTLVRRDDVPVSGTMVRELHDVAVWTIEGRVRRHVRSDAGVKRLGGWEAVRVVPDGSVEEVFPKEGHSIL